MSKWVWLLAALVAALLILVVWSMRGGDGKARAKATGPDAGVSEATAPGTRGAIRPKLDRRPKPAVDDDKAPEMIDPKSEKFSQRIDVGIPFRLRSELAHCYSGGLDPDLSLKIRYRLKISKGRVTTSDVEAASSEVDRKLRNCMLDAVRKASWELRDMPDFTEEKELFVRLRTLKKYKDRAEFDD